MQKEHIAPFINMKYRNFGTGAKIVVVIVGVVPIDINLAITGIPVHVRNVAIGITRTRFIV
jgi:hypothetical protein